MTGTELWVLRDWMMDKTYNEYYHLVSPVVDILNESIKENFLTVEVPQESKTLPKEIVSYLVRNGKKITVIKVLRNVFGWGLKDCKDYMESNWDSWLAKCV